MKHLEGFSWFRKKKETPIIKPIIEQNVIDDILLELKDLGVILFYRDFNNDKYGHVKEILGSYHEYFAIADYETVTLMDWKDIKDCLLRLKDYLGKNYVTFYYRNRRKAMYEIVLNENTNIDVPILSFRLIYHI